MSSFSSDNLSSLTFMNKLVMNFFVTEGLKDAAEKFHVDASLPPQIKLNSNQLQDMENRVSICDAILVGKIEHAISLINDWYPELLDDNRKILFRLQQQHLIELIKDDQMEKCLDYASEHIWQRAIEVDDGDNNAVVSEIEKTVALLAFPQPANSPFSALLTQSHRQKVASEMNSVLLQTTYKGMDEAESKLTFMFKMLSWAHRQLLEKTAPPSAGSRVSGATVGATENTGTDLSTANNNQLVVEIQSLLSQTLSTVDIDNID